MIEGTLPTKLPITVTLPKAPTRIAKPWSAYTTCAIVTAERTGARSSMSSVMARSIANRGLHTGACGTRCANPHRMTEESLRRDLRRLHIELGRAKVRGPAKRDRLEELAVDID